MSPTLREWMERVRKQPVMQDILEGLIPAQPAVILLGGRTGIGKTILAMQLILAIASGVDFLDIKTKQTKGGYLGFEGGEQKMCDRAEKLQIAYPNGAFDNFEFELSAPFKLTGQGEDFTKLYSPKELGLLAFDPLKYLVSGDYSKPADALRFITTLQTVADKLHLPILLCHHIRKPDARSLIEPGELYELKGASDYVDHATTVMLLERERQQHRPGGGWAPRRIDYFVLHFAKARNAIAAIPPITIKLNRDKLIFEKAEDGGEPST